MEADLAGRLRAETRSLHNEVERSPFIARLMAGRMDRASYCLLLRNLHSIYRSMETGAQRVSGRGPLVPLFAPPLARLAALEADLHFLQGPDWPQALALLPAAAAYAGHLDRIGPARSHLLAAHAYVRYLGDLAGGQQLRGIVAHSLKLPGAEGTAFYAFGSPADVQRLVGAFRQGLDLCADGSPHATDIVAEAQLAFRMHQALFTELEHARGRACSTPAATR